MCRFAPEISADKEENRRNPDGFQDFLTQSSGNLWREAVCGDLISGSLDRLWRKRFSALLVLTGKLVIKFLNHRSGQGKQRGIEHRKIPTAYREW